MVACVLESSPSFSFIWKIIKIKKKISVFKTFWCMVVGWMCYILLNEVNVLIIVRHSYLIYNAAPDVILLNLPYIF